MSINKFQLAEFLEEKAMKYCASSFIETDPIQIPHQFTKKEDIEIAGLLIATIAWGNRTMIIKNGYHMLSMLDNSPFDFILNASPKDITSLSHFKHRTFNEEDFQSFIYSLQNIYQNLRGLEDVFSQAYSKTKTIHGAIHNFRNQFIISSNFLDRSQKHVPNVQKKSAAKRINMFLRWMVRKDEVDFGLWNSIPKSALMLPLDVHTGRVGRTLGLLERKQNDWKAVEEITGSLRSFDPNDPVKYDYALFGIGAFEKDIF